LRPQVTMEVCLAALFLLSIGWCFSLARRAYGARSDAFAWWVAILLLFIVGVYPWRDYAQREHLLVLAVMPYLVMAAARLDGTVAPVWEAVAAGLLAAVDSRSSPTTCSCCLASKCWSPIAPGFTADTAGAHRPGGRGRCLLRGGLAVHAGLHQQAHADPVRYVSRLYELADPAGRIVAVDSQDRRGDRRLGDCPASAALSRLGSLFIMASVAATVGFVIQHKDIPNQFLPAKLFIMSRLASCSAICSCSGRSAATCPWLPPCRGRDSRRCAGRRLCLLSLSIRAGAHRRE